MTDPSLTLAIREPLGRRTPHPPTSTGTHWMFPHRSAGHCWLSAAQRAVPAPVVGELEAAPSSERYVDPPRPGWAVPARPWRTDQVSDSAVPHLASHIGTGP